MNRDHYPTIHADEKLWVTYYRTAYAVKRNIDRELAKYGLTWIQSSVLQIIKQSEELLTPTDIARRLFRQSHTISELIKRMEKQDLVKRVRDLKKKNVIRVLLTSRGEKLLGKVKVNQVIHEVFSVLEEKEQEQLLEFIIPLRDKAIETLNISYTKDIPNFRIG